MKKLIIVFLSFVLILTISACGYGNNDANKTSSENPGMSGAGGEKQPKMTKDKAYEIGEYAKTEHYEVAIVKVTKPTEWVFEPEEGKEYVAVEISVKNISDEDGSVGQSDFQYVGEDGKLHGRYPNTYSGFGVEPATFGAEDLAIGESFNGTIVYLLPKSINEVELWYREGWTATPDAIFKFSK